MPPRPSRRSLPPLDEPGLNRLALRYVERFATTRAKLRSYLERKLRERGWGEERSPDLAALAEDFARRGYVDDASYALMKSRSLVGRGYGERRLSDALRAAGVDESSAEAARRHAEEESVAAAIRFAQRRRIGPFGREAEEDVADRQKALGALVRAGHDFALARAIVAMPPDRDADPEALARKLADDR